MSISQFRSAEPLYLVVLRSSNATAELREWANRNKQQVSIDGNRMKLFDHNTLVKFQLTWQGSWHQVSIWDTWNRRHVVM